MPIYGVPHVNHESDTDVDWINEDEPILLLQKIRKKKNFVSTSNCGKNLNKKSAAQTL
jgi:hypothetical protein